MLRDAVAWTETGEPTEDLMITPSWYGSGLLLTQAADASVPEITLDTTQIEHDTKGDESFGIWDAFTETSAGRNVRYSRHGSLMNDGYSGRGNLWW